MDPFTADSIQRIHDKLDILMKRFDAVERRMTALERAEQAAANEEFKRYEEARAKRLNGSEGL